MKREMKRKIKHFVYKIAKISLIAKILGTVFYDDEKVEQVVKQQFPNYADMLTQQVKKDVAYSRYRYRVSPYEYFLFNFIKLSPKERESYIGDEEFIDLCIEHLREEERWILRNKYLTYETFKTFYKRECMKVESEEDRELFYTFTKKHPKFVLKAISKSKGQDNYVFDLNKANEKSREEIFALIESIGICIVEEFVVQSNEMAKFHPGSVNTIRFVTYRTNKECIDVYAYIRIGCDDSHVDNVSAGGVFAVVDTSSGKIISKGIRRCNGNVEEFVRHPDTNELILDAQVPKWNEARKFVHLLTDVLPEARYVGWDIALTDTGWVMIEGNSKPSLNSIQAATQNGMRRKVEAFFTGE